MFRKNVFYLLATCIFLFAAPGIAHAQKSGALPTESPVLNERETGLPASELYPSSSGEVPGEASGLEGLETFFDGAAGALMEVHDLPGITVSVVHNGEIAFAKGYGLADVARMRPVDPETTLFRIGSTSKTFTWTAVMQLVEQGKLDLDTDVNEYLTAFQIPEAFGEPITLRHILTHTGGFEDGVLGYLLRRTEDDFIGLEQWLETYMPARVRAPGSFSSYSNYATALAGYIVAEISGMDYDTYIERNIFKPLSMTHSTFREPVPDPLAPHLSANFNRKGGDYENAEFEFIHDAGPAGGMSSTAVDMAKWMLVHLGDGEYNGARILKPETARLMRMRLHENHESLPAMLYGFYEATINGRFAYGHGGDTIIFHTNMLMMPEEDVGIFVSTNAADGGRAREQIVKAFFNHYFPLESGYPHPSPEKPEKPDEEATQALAKYAGTYRGNRRSYTKWEKALALASGDTSIRPSSRGGLVVSGGGGQRFVSVGDGVFRSVDDPNNQIAFRENDRGEVTHYFVGFPAGAQDKIGFWERAQTHQLILGVCALIFVGLILGSLWGAPKWFAMSGGEKLARGAVFAAALINLAFLGVFVTTITSSIDTLIYTGLPNAGVVLMLPVIGAAFTAVSTIMLVPAWRGAYWSWFGRLRYTTVIIALIIFALCLNYWNLFGPWYGW